MKPHQICMTCRYFFGSTSSYHCDYKQIRVDRREGEGGFCHRHAPKTNIRLAVEYESCHHPGMAPVWPHAFWNMSCGDWELAHELENEQAAIDLFKQE